MAKPPRFHTRQFPRRRRKKSILRSARPFLWLALILAIAAGFNKWRGGDWLSPTDWQSAPSRFTICGEGGSAACVIDGDTIAIGKRKIRLTGFNAPELAGECPAEALLAQRARSELAAWLNAGSVEFDGGDEPPFDQYGRELRSASRLTADGKREWLAEHMIEAGYAQSTGWDAPRGGWC